MLFCIINIIIIPRWYTSILCKGGAVRLIYHKDPLMLLSGDETGSKPDFIDWLGLKLGWE